MKKQKKLTLFLIVLGLMICALRVWATGEQEEQEKMEMSFEPVTIVIANSNAPSQPINLALERWIKIVEEKTNGRIKFKFLPGGVVTGNQQDAYSQVKTGSIDITTGAQAYFDVPALQIQDFPYAFESAKDWRRFMESEYVQKYYEDFIEKAGLRVIGITTLGIRHLTTRDKVVLKPSDLERLKIRAVPIDIYTDTVRCMGAKPTPVSFQEVLSGLKTGVIDGQENPIPTIYQMKFYQAQKYCMLTGHMRSGSFIIMNEKKFQYFPKNVQVMLLETLRNEMLWADNLIEKQETELISKLEEEGIVFIGPEEGLQLDVFIEKIRSCVWPKYEKEIEGIKELMNVIREKKY